MNLLKRFPLILLSVWLQTGLAEEMTADRVKSAYVLNFAKFVEWPAGAMRTDNKVILCVVGRDVLGGILDELDGRKVGTRMLHVVDHATAGSDLGTCQLVFIGESERHSYAAILKAIENSPVLTISDIEGFAEDGGCIGLGYRDDKIVFEVNLASVQKSKLHLPSQLLNLAAYVFGR